MKRILIAAGFALAGAAGACLAMTYAFVFMDQAIATRLSPDETIRARLARRPIERSFSNPTLRLQYLDEGREVTIFHSPDTAGPQGTERLVWSKDGAWLLLVGRHFFVKDDLFLDNGDQLYFLYHVPTATGWCNSNDSRLPPLKAEQVRAVEFTEPVVLKGD